MYSKLYSSRFEILLTSQLTILFGGLLFPLDWFNEYVSPILFILNLIAGILLFSGNKKKMWFVVILLLTAIISLSIGRESGGSHEFSNSILHLSAFFLFHVLLAVELIIQVFAAKTIAKNVIFGLIGGYISLGLVGFFICLSIEILHPGAFHGLTYMTGDVDTRGEELLYYSYITLMTIGYGEISPVLPAARKAAVLIGLMGQFYLVVLTAIIVGKYINQNHLNEKS